jgi:hypothetical protein
MTAATGERLYQLLPAIYRVRDAAQGEPLRALFAVLERERALLEGDIGRLYDNWFIETCEEWVVPYLGDLLGVRGLVPVREGAFSQRALVANTLAYRRAKGTAAVLGQLARDVTGWPARVVEFFDLLATTQYLNHVRPAKGATADLRDANQLELGGGPFERTAHTADVRHIDSGRGRYNIPNVGIFVWRLQSYAVPRGTARAVASPADGRYTFHPLGVSALLFNRPRTEAEMIGPASEENVPGPLRRRPLYDELEAGRQALVDHTTPHRVYFGDPPVLQVFVSGMPVPPEQIAICNLGDPPSPLPEGWRRPFPSKSYVTAGGGTAQAISIQVAVDPVLGRLAFPSGVLPGQVEVGYVYGFSGDLGGGPYDRRGSVSSALTRPVTWQMGVTQGAPASQSQVVRTLTEAVQAWNIQPAGTVGMIAIMDSRTYTENLTGSSTITIPAASQLMIIAADWPEEDVPGSPGQKQRAIGGLAAVGRRPHLQGNISVRGAAATESLNCGELILDGLLIEGGVTVLVGNLGSLGVIHTTLVPGLGGLTVNPSVQPDEQNQRLTVWLERSICGRLTLPPSIPGVRVKDSIVDGAGGPAIAAPGATAVVHESTIIGGIVTGSLEASNSILTGRVSAARRQVGCVRFCYLPLDSVAPRRYRCRPGDAVSATQVVPQFTSVTYGHPAYGQLAAACPQQIGAGADDEGEMGAFHFLQQAQRLKSLQTHLDEYLRFGLEAGAVYVT